jgi:hypothetical protein
VALNLFQGLIEKLIRTVALDELAASRLRTGGLPERPYPNRKRMVGRSEPRKRIDIVQAS